MAEATIESSAQETSLVDYYVKEFSAAERNLEKFCERGRQAVRRYIDDRGAVSDVTSLLNLFWSNVNIQQAALYAKQPKVDVSRRHKDPSDDVGRVAGEMVERILNIDMDNQTSDIDVALRNCIEDRLVPGMGQVWCRYDPTFVKQANPAYAEGMEDDQREVEVIGDERVATDYVYWQDFLWSPARTWQDVRWVARAIYMTRDELVEKFGEDMGNQVPLNHNGYRGKDADGISPQDPWQKACVWEVWNKTKRKVCWYVKGFDKILREEDDPLQLDGFFPCPCPFVANTTTSSFVPKSDYEMLRDQYGELDMVSNRIALLEEAIKVIGVYDKTTGELGRMLNGNVNQMIAADNWAMFAEKGGIKGSVDWFPLDMVVTALEKLRETKAALIHDLYELTGISDIMRGSTVASETATAQQLKAQFGSVRMQRLQNGLATFVQQILQIKAEILAAHFQPETIIRQSMIEFAPGDDVQFAQSAIQRLKDKRLAHYSLQVDPDSMALADYAAEQKQRSECIGAIAQFITAAMPLIQLKPESIPFLLQILQWYLASFKAGKQIEGVLDQAVTAITSAPQGPDPMALAMGQANLKKVQSEGAKNESAAVLNFEKAKTAQMDSAASLIDALKPEPQPAFAGPRTSGNPEAPRG